MYDLKENHDKKSNRGVLLLLLFLLTVFLVTMKFHGLLLKGHAQNFEEIETNKLIYDLKDGKETIEIYGNGYLLKNKKLLGYYDFSGQRLWKKELSKEQQVIPSETLFYIIDALENFVKAVDLKGQTLWTYEVGGRVKSIYEVASYTFIISGEEKAWLHIINDEGSVIVQQLLLRDNFLKAYIDKEKGTMALTYLDVKEEEIISKLQVYNFDGEKLWEKSFEDEIIQRIIFMPQKPTLILTDKRLLCLEEDRLLWQKTMNGTVMDLKIENNQAYVLIKSKKSYIEVMDLKGKVTLHYALQRDYNKIRVVDDRLYIGSDAGVLQINHRGEKEALYLCQTNMVDFYVTDVGIVCLTEKDLRIFTNKDL